MSSETLVDDDLMCHALAQAEAHGTALLLLARALTDDDDKALRTVAQVLSTDERAGSGVPITRAELARQVFLRGRNPVSDDRVTLAVCAYGGLSCRQAADLLELTESLVAVHLRDALRRIRDDQTSPGSADPSGIRPGALPAGEDRQPPWVRSEGLREAL